MTVFSYAFRRNVTVPAALFGMLYSEECLGEETFARKTMIAMENVHHDLEMLSLARCATFTPHVTEQDAFNKLIEMADNFLQANDNLLPDEAIIYIISAHQKRNFEFEQDAKTALMAHAPT